MHPLKRYLAEVKESVQNFSVRVGTSRQTLYRIVIGSQAPKPALARRIVEATGGVVTFSALYGGEGAEVIALESSHEEDSALDSQRLLMAICVVCDQVSPQGLGGPPPAMLEIATEAVVNTYIALQKVTTCRGPDRLRQALRPVLEEILKEYLAFLPPPSVLDQGAVLAAELYFQAENLSDRIQAQS